MQLTYGLAVFAALSVTQAGAQEAATVDVRLDVLPPSLTVTITSAEVDFAEQRPDAGRVDLDPVTGEISGKVSGRHALGELSLSGPAKGAYAVAIEPWPLLTGAAGRVSFGLRWARNASCRESGFEELSGNVVIQGILGPSGCTSFRFGGAVHLLSTPAGRYGGRLRVRVIPL